MKRPRVAIFDFAGCEGCQLQIVNMEEEILDLLTVIDPVQWREAMSESSDAFDVAIVEGSITRPADEQRLRDIRATATTLVALGACATTGGVNALKNRFDMDEVRRCVYGDRAGMAHLETAPARALHDVVEVDVEIHGCPIDAAEFASVLKALLTGRRPARPADPVCVECKRRETVCRYAYGEICLGPITRAGCHAWCPANGVACFGCRGWVDRPNLSAAQAAVREHGLSEDDLREKMALFGSAQEPAP
jgi:coenzyme F420-reducing hydrogenase gamma subunit